MNLKEGEIVTHIKTVLDKVILKTLYKGTDENFIKYIKEWYTINALCDLLDINRNRYNYLVRTNQLDSEILKIKR